MPKIAPIPRGHFCRFFNDQEESMEDIKIKDNFAGKLERGSLTIAQIDKDSLHEGVSVARGYKNLRTVKYKQYGYIEADSLDDIDSDDNRSTHLTALQANGDGSATVVGSMRLISKESVDEAPLPIESMFDASLEMIVKPKAIEVSRFITEGEQHHMVRTRLFQVALKRVIEDGNSQTLAVVDSWFKDYLRDKVRVPVKEVTPELKIAKYPLEQVGIDIDFHTLQRNMGLKALEVAHEEVGVRYYKF